MARAQDSFCCFVSYDVMQQPFQSNLQVKWLAQGALRVARDIKSTDVQPQHRSLRFVLPLQANVEKTAFILSYLTSKGRVPLLGLNDVINTILQVGIKKRISWLLLQALHQSRFASSPNTGMLIILT